jgi:molecular chaperone GrpE
MNSNRETENGKEFLEDIEMEDLRSVDDFFKELEAKEKDLHITSEMVIEVEDSDFEDSKVPDFPMADFLPPGSGVPQPAYAANNYSRPDESAKFENEISELKGRISKMEAERIEIYENAQRRSRDFENYKSRTERDRQENLLNQVSNLATEILPVLDNLDRALECATRDSEQNDFKQFYDGIVLVNQQLNEVLAEMGLQPISAVGEHFDPHFHEAVAMEETTEYPPNVITSELLKGYKIGDRVVRAAMVKVSTAPKYVPTEILPETEEVSDQLVEPAQWFSDMGE